MWLIDSGRRLLSPKVLLLVQQWEVKSVQRATGTWHAAHNEYFPLRNRVYTFAMNFGFVLFLIGIKEYSEVPDLLIIKVEKHINFT